MTDTPASLNLKNLLDHNSGPGICVTLHRTLSLTTGDSGWGATIERKRLTKSGREGKPEHVILLVAGPDDNAGDLLRQIADLYDAGEVSIEDAKTRLADIQTRFQH